METLLTHVRPETAQYLAAQAKTQGLSVDAYLQLLLGMAGRDQDVAALSPTAFEALMDELAEGSEGLAPLPPDFSRADIYLQRD